MIIMRLPIVAATLIAASASLGTFLSFVDSASAQEVITCSSNGNERNICETPNTGRVRLIRQLSNADCRGNWDYNRNRIVVRNGCRAEFLIENDRNNRNGRHYRNGRYYRYDRDDRYYRNNRSDIYRRDGRDDRENRYDIYRRDGSYDRDYRYDRDDRNYGDDRYNQENRYYIERR